MSARFYHHGPIQVGIVLTLSQETSRHATQVLRLKVGDKIILFNGEGGEFSATLTQARKSACQVHIEEFFDVDRESSLCITLAQAICANEKMDWIIQKAVEQGVTVIQPLMTTRTLVRLSGERADKRQQHWQRVMLSACEQCGRNRIPQLLPLMSLSHWLETQLSNQQQTNTHALLLAPDAQQRLTELTPPNEKTGICLLAGPEGGWTTEEQNAAQLAGFTPVRLGPRVLRTETAALTAIASAQALWGDY